MVAVHGGQGHKSFKEAFADAKKRVRKNLLGPRIKENILLALKQNVKNLLKRIHVKNNT